MTEEFRREVLDQLKECGSNFSRPHKLDFYLYVPTESAAKRAAKKVRESQFTVQIHPPPRKGDAWLCLASITVAPETAALSQIGDFFTQIAASLGGEFDGWNARIEA